MRLNASTSAQPTVAKLPSISLSLTRSNTLDVTGPKFPVGETCPRLDQLQEMYPKDLGELLKRLEEGGWLHLRTKARRQVRFADLPKLLGFQLVQKFLLVAHAAHILAAHPITDRAGPDAGPTLTDTLLVKHLILEPYKMAGQPYSAAKKDVNRTQEEFLELICSSVNRDTPNSSNAQVMSRKAAFFRVLSQLEPGSASVTENAKDFASKWQSWQSHKDLSKALVGRYENEALGSICTALADTGNYGPNSKGLEKVLKDMMDKAPAEDLRKIYGDRLTKMQVFRNARERRAPS